MVDGPWSPVVSATTHAAGSASGVLNYVGAATGAKDSGGWSPPVSATTLGFNAGPWSPIVSATTQGAVPDEEPDPPTLLGHLPTGTLANGAVLNENSGFASSRLHSNVFWCHEDNDAVMPRAVYAIGHDMAIKKIIQLTGTGIQTGQWEDIAYDATRGTSGAYWIANCGDNTETSTTFRAYLWEEPTALTSPGTVLDVAVNGVYEFTWPDAVPGNTGWNCEAMMVSPTGRLYFITKTLATRTALYRAPASLVTYDVGPNALVRVQSLTDQGNVCAADWASDNSMFVTAGNTEEECQLYNTTTFALIEKRPIPVAHKADGVAMQDESLTWTPNSKALIRGSEGPGSEVWFIPMVGEGSGGTASGSWSFSGSASAGGVTTIPRTIPLNLRGSATNVHTGTASGAWAFVRSATGKRPAKGSDTSTWTYVGAAVGRYPRYEGDAAGTWSLAGAAVGVRPRRIATGTWSYAGEAAGKRAPKGSKASTLVFVGAAHGRNSAVLLKQSLSFKRLPLRYQASVLPSHREWVRRK